MKKTEKKAKKSIMDINKEDIAKLNPEEMLDLALKIRQAHDLNIRYLRRIIRDKNGKKD